MRVLLVEDDEAVRLTLQETLEFERHHEVVAAASGEAAWDLYRREPFPLALLDWVLPGMDGLELCRRIRSLPDANNTLVIVVTGRTGHEDLSAVLDAGADDYLPKPFDLNQLDIRLSVAERRVSEIAARSRAERALQLLAETSSLLGAALDPRDTLERIARLPLRILADWTAVDVVEGDSLRRAAVASTDAATAPAADQLHKQFPPDLASDSPIARVIRTGQPIVASALPAPVFVAPSTGHSPSSTPPGHMGYIVVPLTARGHAMGALTLVAAGRRYTAADLELAREVAVRCALALDNARLYAEARRLRQRDLDAAKLEGVLLAARTAAHEINNALAVPAGYAELLSLHPTIAGDPALLRQMREIRDSAERAASTLLRLQRVIRLEEVDVAMGPDRPVLDLSRSIVSRGDGAST